MGKKLKDKDISELLKNAEFMRDKLNESREAMKEMPIVMPYDNGGGQKGIRENPAFPAYEKLLKSYLATLSALRDTSEQMDETNKFKSRWLTLSNSYARTKEKLTEESAS